MECLPLSLDEPLGVAGCVTETEAETEDRWILLLWTDGDGSGWS